MQFVENAEAIYVLSADCKFPEKPVVVDIPVEICTLMVKQIDKVSYMLANVSV